MKAIYTREPNKEEREALEKGLKSPSGFTIRRSQIILMSVDEGLKAQAIGKQVGRSDQQVHQVLHTFNSEGISCLPPKTVGRQDDQQAYDDSARTLLHE